MNHYLTLSRFNSFFIARPQQSEQFHLVCHAAEKSEGVCSVCALNPSLCSVRVVLFDLRVKMLEAVDEQLKVDDVEVLVVVVRTDMDVEVVEMAADEASDQGGIDAFGLVCG